MKWLAALMLTMVGAMAQGAENAPSPPSRPKWLMQLEGRAMPSATVIIVPPLNHPKWKEECSSCHMAFPPQFLSANSWQRLMAGLENHFGTNAALDPSDAGDILNFLQRNAGIGSKHNAPNNRISGTPWFITTHSKVPNEAWAIEKVKNRANCTACHKRSEHGDWVWELDDSIFQGHIN